MTHQHSLLPRLSHEQWREDLHVFAHELVQRHKNPYHLISQVAFAQAVAALDVQIPHLKDDDIVVGIERLAAMIGDGHTRLDTSELYHVLPFEAFWFGQSLRIVRTLPTYQQALGAQVLAVEHQAIHDLQQRLQAFIPQAENRWYTLHESALRLSSVERLAALGLVPHLGILSSALIQHFFCVSYDWDSVETRQAKMAMRDERLAAVRMRGAGS